MKTNKINVVTEKRDAADGRWGNWANASDALPDVVIDQKTGTVKLVIYEGYDKPYPANVWVGAYVDEINTDDGSEQVVVIGSAHIKNYKRWQGSGEMRFVYIFFRGDSGAVYFHRAPATKSWLAATPAFIRDRLRTLGDKRAKRCGTHQQGDVLLIPAIKREIANCDFKHETQAIGHHKFQVPVLYFDKNGDRFIRTVEDTPLNHVPASGFVHQTIVIPPGTWIVAKPASSLAPSKD